MIKSDICRRLVHLAAGAATLALASPISLVLTTHSASPQTRTIKIINPFPPGGAADIIGHVVTEQISRTRGVTFVFEKLQAQYRVGFIHILWEGTQ